MNHLAFITAYNISKMKRTVSIISLAGLLAWPAFSQSYNGHVDPSKVPVPSWHYQSEYTFDRPSDPESWQGQKSGLNAAFGSTNELYMRTAVPELPAMSTSWEARGWKGERLNTQILIWSPDTLGQVRLKISDLRDPQGHVLKNSHFKANLVRYVLSNFPYAENKVSCDASAGDTAYLMPDRFEPFERFDLPGRTLRPVWISFEIPGEALPGVYTGNIEIFSEKYRTKLPVKITIQGLILPDPHDWKYRLDLWQNPWIIATYYNVEPWSDEHKALLKQHLMLYAGAGGKYITTYAIHSPWSDNSYAIEGTMIEWLKKKDGSWNFDYSVFDQYVQLAMETGIDEAITVYTPIPWGFRFRYMDEASGNYIYEEWAPESSEFRSYWNIFLDDLKAHLLKKGWFQKTYLGINENPLENTLAAARVIREHYGDWKITYAGDWHPELSEILDDYSAVISSEPGRGELAKRTSRGTTTTFYVCCTPPRPNNFVFSPPVEGRFISWYAAAYGYNGFLRWAYDAWPADPVRDARHTLWPAGDCFMVYPGGNSSIRFEKLREGIVDYEKIRILRDMAQKSGDKKVKSLLAALESHLNSFVDDPDYSKRNYDTMRITKMILEGERLIAELSDAVETTH